MSYIRTPNTACLICSKSIYRRPGELVRNKGHAFCSMVCYGKFNRREQPCLICKTPIQAHFNKKTCSRVCANKHRAGIKYMLNRPRDVVVNQRRLKLRLLEFRGKICEGCGYNKEEILQVHHIDRNRKNNNLSNLKLICPNCHYEEHYLEKSWLRKYDFESWRLRLS